MSVTISGMRASSIFQVSYGGTGNSELMSGSLIVGSGTDPVAFIPPGSEGQVLTVVNGEWASANNVGGNGGGNGGISAVSSSGNLQGDGTSGSVLTLKDDISLNSVTASFSGDGSGITGLASSQLSDFNSAVDARITNIPNSALQNNSITVNGSQVSLGGSVTIATASANQSFTSINTVTGTVSGDLTVQGNLYVNGAQTVVNTTDLTITDNIILIASGAANAAQLDGAGIHFGRLPSEDARIIYDSDNDWMEIFPAVSASSFRGSFIGDGSGLTGIDSSTKVFTATGISVGQAVALSGSLVVADNSNNLKSNVIGVASAVSGTSVTVKLFGEVQTLSASLYTDIGTEMYLGASGSVTTYANVGSGKYATQVGFISDTGKIILQPRVFGQKA